MNNIVLTATTLLLAHVIADFLLQSKSMIQNKRELGWKSPSLLLHSLVAAILAVVLTWKWGNWFAIGMVTLVSHWCIDAVKTTFYPGSSLKSFLLDQLAHLLVIAGLLFYLHPQLAVAALLYREYLIAIIVCLTGALLIFRPAGFLVENAIQRWAGSIGSSDDSLPEAGKLIGYMERLLIFLFMMMNLYAAIGFLIAAKSILRFRDHPGQQRITEYILLGTLLSFTAAIIISLAVKYALSLLGIG